MRSIACLALALMLTGCVSPRAVLENEGGQRVVCQASGFGIISGTMANNRFEECVSEAQMRGYDVVEGEQ